MCYENLKNGTVLRSYLKSIYTCLFLTLTIDVVIWLKELKTLSIEKTTINRTFTLKRIHKWEVFNTKTNKETNRWTENQRCKEVYIDWGLTSEKFYCIFFLSNHNIKRSYLVNKKTHYRHNWWKVIVSVLLKWHKYTRLIIKCRTVI